MLFSLYFAAASQLSLQPNKEEKLLTAVVENIVGEKTCCCCGLSSVTLSSSFKMTGLISSDPL